MSKHSVRYSYASFPAGQAHSILESLFNMKCLLLIPGLICAGSLHAQQTDVTFIVIGKHANYSQDQFGRRTAVDYSFFSEIFLTSGGDADNATLTFPTGEVVDYQDMRYAADSSRDNVLLVSGADRYTEFADMQRRYPDGEYRVSFATPGGSLDSGILKFDRRGLPNPPHISMQQDGRLVCNRVTPGTDVIVGWGTFAQGRSDPNNILDDLVFVILTDADGIRIAHSGRPFEGRPYLTYADTSFTLDGSILAEGQTYSLSVEHAVVDDTTRLDGVPAFTTRAVTTKIDIEVSATGTGSCMPQQIVPASVVGIVTEGDGYTIEFFEWLETDQ